MATRRRTRRRSTQGGSVGEENWQGGTGYTETSTVRGRAGTRGARGKQQFGMSRGDGGTVQTNVLTNQLLQDLAGANLIKKESFGLARHIIGMSVRNVTA